MTTSRKPTVARAASAVAAACALALAVAAPAPAQTTSGTAPDAGSANTAKGARVLDAKVTPRRAYYYGLKQVSFSVTLAASAPTDVRIDIVRNKSGALERSLFLNKVQPRTASSATWDGLSGSGTAVRGKLRFVIKAANGATIPYAKRFLRAASAGKKKGKRRDRFGYFDYIFPVRAKHSYGDGIGAPRGDHTHQGQDISAPCGTKLVAAQGGTVKVNAFQAGGAGYYVVITTIGGTDHVYMHLIGAPALTVGQTVLTGQAIGQVGNTGRSSGCHLHYEIWSAPGWYSGGSFLDPAPYLRAWDKYS